MKKTVLILGMTTLLSNNVSMAGDGPSGTFSNFVETIFEIKDAIGTRGGRKEKTKEQKDKDKAAKAAAVAAAKRADKALGLN